MPTTAVDAVRRSPSPAAVRATLLAAGAILVLAALAHVLRYVLLLINRTTLLPPLVADGALLMGVLVSLAALAAVIAAAAVLTAWLVARRAAVFRFHGRDDPRPEWQLWAGCLVPVVNLVWAPVFVLELAHAEQSQSRLRPTITAWWLAWVFATAVCGWATWTSTATAPQAVADNTVTVILAYVAGAVVLMLLWRLFDALVRKPVERPLHRWVVVGPDLGRPATDVTGAPVLESAPVESPDAARTEDRQPVA